MKIRISINKDTPLDKIPELLHLALINTVAHEVFSSAIANAIVRDVNPTTTEAILSDLLRFYFDSHPTALLSVDIDVKAESTNVFASDAPNLIRAERRTIQIPSENTVGLSYTVTLEDGHAISCACPHHQKAHQFCKHMVTAERLV